MGIPARSRKDASGASDHRSPRRDRWFARVEGTGHTEGASRAPRAGRIPFRFLDEPAP